MLNEAFEEQINVKDEIRQSKSCQNKHSEENKSLT